MALVRHVKYIGHPVTESQRLAFVALMSIASLR